VTAVGHFEGDMHDFRITPSGTALMVIYNLKAANLVEFGGPQNGFIFDGGFQEVDIATGDLIFEWHLSHHVPLNATYTTDIRGEGKDSTAPWDPYHINSVEKDASGNYLVSVRHTHSLYCIDGTAGDILWTLGGKYNEFTDASDGRATDFAWQHDARWHDERTITIFDNSAKDFLGPISTSRGMIIDLDVSNKVATVREEYFHPQGLRAHSQGNMQILPESRNAFVGWGHCAAYTEFAPDGEVLCDTHLSPSNWFQLGLVVTYRTYKYDWVGKPLTIPTAVVVGNSVYASWNGATEISAWRLELCDQTNNESMTFTTAKTTVKTGFETMIELPEEIAETCFRLAALDSHDGVLGRTELLSKHPRQTLAETLRSEMISQLSYPVLVTLLMISCCAIMAIFGLWQRLGLTRVCSRRQLFRRGCGQPRGLSLDSTTEDDVAIPLITNTYAD
jgi:hypothetical protein